MITNTPQVTNYPDPAVFCSSNVSCDAKCLVGAGIIYDRIVPVFVGLRQHAIDALGQVLFAIIDGSNDRDERRYCAIPLD